MDSRDALIEELRAVVARLEAKAGEQAARIKELELELAKAKKDSSTSSKPPSIRQASKTTARGTGFGASRRPRSASFTSPPRVRA